MQPVVSLPAINSPPAPTSQGTAAFAVQQHLQNGKANWVTWTRRLQVESQDGGRRGRSGFDFLCGGERKTQHNNRAG